MHALTVKNASDQESPMTVFGVLLCTHHRKSVLLEQGTQFRQSFYESLGSRHQVVTHMALIVIEALVVRSPSELPPKKHVPHAFAP